MPRRHMNNLGTGIQWSYGYDAPLDDGWRQNRKTGGWFKVDIKPDLETPPTPYTAEALKSVSCQYFNIYGGKCRLWNSGYLYCCDFKCKYNNVKNLDSNSTNTCFRCAYFYKDKCCHDEVRDEIVHSMAHYCCYYQTKENHKTLYERIRDQVMAKRANAPTTENEIKTTSQETVDFYWLESDQKVCYDKNKLTYQLVAVKRKSGKMAQLNMLVCNRCQKKFIIKSRNTYDISKFLLTAHDGLQEE